MRVFKVQEHIKSFQSLVRKVRVIIKFRNIYGNNYILKLVNKKNINNTSNVFVLRKYPKWREKSKQGSIRESNRCFNRERGGD